jgi:DNA-directed RNA polymerase III subunit RPC2
MRADSEEELQDQHLLLPEILRARGLFRHHIDSYDYFVKQDMKQILLANQFVRSEADPNFYLRYLDVRVNRPNVQDQFISSAVTPMECRLRELTYSAPIVVDVEYTRGRHIVRKNDVEIGRIPVMLKSCVCVLTGKNEEELAKMRECPNDPGGYFISNGAEKVVLIQEQLSKNRIILEYNKDSNVMASVTSSTHERRSKTNIYAKKNYIYLQHNSFIEDLPICIVLKGMGIETDQEAILLVGTENLQLFSLSIEEARSIGILTQYQALEYIGKRVRPSKFSG